MGLGYKLMKLYPRAHVRQATGLSCSLHVNFKNATNRDRRTDENDIESRRHHERDEQASKDVSTTEQVLSLDLSHMEPSPSILISTSLSCSSSYYRASRMSGLPAHRSSAVCQSSPCTHEVLLAFYGSPRSLPYTHFILHQSLTTIFFPLTEKPRRGDGERCWQELHNFVRNVNVSHVHMKTILFRALCTHSCWTRMKGSLFSPLIKKMLNPNNIGLD